MTNTERITLHVCNKHSVGVPYPFTTVITEVGMQLKDWLWTAVFVLFACAVGACMIRGACDYAGDIWRAL